MGNFKTGRRSPEGRPFTYRAGRISRKGQPYIESVKALTGGSNRTELEKWVKNLRIDPKESNAALHEMLARGISPERLTESMFAVFRDMWIFLWGEKGMDALEISEEEGKFLKEETPF